MKKHAALSAELAGHDGRIAAVVQSGTDMVSEGHFAAEDINIRIMGLQQHWQSLKDKAAQRKLDLEDSLQAQQYFAGWFQCDDFHTDVLHFGPPFAYLLKFSHFLF